MSYRKSHSEPSFFPVNVSGAGFSTGISDGHVGNAYFSAGRPVVPGLNSPTCSSSGQFTSSSDMSQLGAFICFLEVSNLSCGILVGLIFVIHLIHNTEPPRKRIHVDLMKSFKKKAVPGEIGSGLGTNKKSQVRTEHSYSGSFVE